MARFDLYRVNPPLTRMIASVPIALSAKPIDLQDYDEAAANRPEFLIGARFAGIEGYARILTHARWMLVPIASGGALVCAFWAMRIYGSPSMVAAAVLWVTCPTVLGHGHLITPDVSAAVTACAAVLMFRAWIVLPSWEKAGASGVCLGIALLAKFTNIVLVPLLAVVYVAWIWRLRKPMSIWTSEWKQLACIGVVAVYVVNVGYAFEGSGDTLGRYKFISTALKGDTRGVQDCQVCPLADSGNRFNVGHVGLIPILLPRNYLLGIDRQCFDFELKLWSYLGGEWKRGGWWYYYLYALAIKVPLGTGALLGLATWCSLFRQGYSAGWRDELVLLAPLFTILIFVSSQTGFSHHMRYVLPIFPFAFIWASKVFRSYELKHYKTFTVACAALLWSVVSSLSVYPHSLSYFNELVGGPKGGHWHLGNSNIDWGQDLLYLKKWLDAHPEASHSAAGPIGVSYDNILDPSVVGIEYSKPPVGPTAIEQELPPPEQQGPLPGWYAISVNHLHGRTKEYEYFLRFEPVAMVGYSMYIYHLTPDQVNPVRRELGLPEAEECGG